MIVLNRIFLEITNSTNSVSEITLSPDFWVNVVLVMIVTGSIGISIYFNRETLRRTDNHLDFIKSELQLKLKPVIQIQNISNYLPVPDNDKYYTLTGDITNQGTVEAENIIIYNYSSPTRISLEKLLEFEKKSPAEKVTPENMFTSEILIKREFGSLLPNAVQAYAPSCNIDKSVHQAQFIVVWLKYDYLEIKNVEQIFMFHVITDELLNSNIKMYREETAWLQGTYLDKQIKETRKNIS